MLLQWRSGSKLWCDCRVSRRNTHLLSHNSLKLISILRKRQSLNKMTFVSSIGGNKKRLFILSRHYTYASHKTGLESDVAELTLHHDNGEPRKLVEPKSKRLLQYPNNEPKLSIKRQTYKEDFCEPNIENKYYEVNDIPNTKNNIARIDEKFTFFKNKKIYVERFKKQRSSIIDHFTKDENVDLLFDKHERNKNTDWHELATMQETETNSKLQVKTTIGKLFDSDPHYIADLEMTNSLNLLSYSFINIFLIEMNIKNAFSENRNFKYPSTSPFNSSKYLRKLYKTNPDSKIFQYLAHDFSHSKPSNNTSFEDFIENVKSDELNQITNNQTKKSLNFNSLQTYRYLFSYFKSAKYLSYDASDLTNFTKSRIDIRFKSTSRSSTKYINKFRYCFRKYESNIDSPFSHLSLILDLTKCILKTNNYIPTVYIFKYLIDKFGSYELYNYQSLVYDCLPPYNTSPITLSTPSSSSSRLKSFRYYFQFQSLIESDSEFLLTLLKFQIVHNDKETFEELLKFFKLRELREYEKCLDRLSNLISKSRFTYNFNKVRDKEIANGEPSFVFKTDEPIFVSINTIYTAIEGCIKFKLFEYVDVLFNKITIFSLYEEQNQTIRDKIPISFGSRPEKAEQITKSLTIARPISPDRYGTMIFNKRMFKLLLRASIDANDAGRLLWLVPHLDKFISSNLSSINEHINYLRDITKQQNEHFKSRNEVQEFDTKEENALVDSELADIIFLVLNTFNLEGKILLYQKIFDFENIDFAKIKQLRSKS